MNDTVIDPKTGEPIVPDPGGAPADPEGPKFVPVEQFDAAVKRLDAFEKGVQFGQGQAPPPSAAPPTPAGPTVADQISDIDKELTTLGQDIDAAIADDKPISNLLVKQRNLADKRLEIKLTSEHIAPLREFGTMAIDQLSAQAASSTQDLATKFDFVKQDMDVLLNALPPEQRTLEVRNKAYQMAVGQNYRKIEEAQKEEWLRENPAVVQDIGGTDGRSANGGDPSIPKPEEVWDRDNLRALKEAGKTVDSYVQGRGYTDWADYYTQNKDYLEL